MRQQRTRSIGQSRLGNLCFIIDGIFKLPSPVSSDQPGVEGTSSPASRDVMVLTRNLQLSAPQQDLLSRGLSFIPSIHTDKNLKLKLQFDMQHYHRRIKLAAYYHNSRRRSYLPFTGTSTWTPPLNKLPPEITELIKTDMVILDKQKPIRERLNISSQEILALKALKQNKNIIKAADKGSAVLSRDQYMLEVQRQLTDSEYYRKLDKPIYPDTIPLLKSILDSLQEKKFINKKQSVSSGRRITEGEEILHPPQDS